MVLLFLIKSGFLSDLKYDKRKEPDKRL